MQMVRNVRLVLSFALLLIGVGLLASPAAAQEFNCSVTVNYSTLSGNDFSYLQELEQRIEEYFNHQRWTEDRFEEYERIDCTVQITFEEAITLTSFKARLIIASRRPIYGATQFSTVVQFNDPEWQFNYVQGGPIIFDLERYDALTSVLDFYAYVMLGYDYDTFSELGGTRYFERARRIAELAQAQSAPGWSQIGSDRGRANLISQILDPRYRPLRKAYFDYHFQGLDHFVSKTEAARASVMSVLEVLATLNEEVSRQFVFDLFFSAKYQELTALFKDAPQRSQAYAVLSQLDPAHMTEYNQLLQ